MPPTLHVLDVAFSHGARPVLRDVTLTVSPGMRVGVLGPNGVGKSTLLGVLAGRLVPERGSLELHPASGTIGELRQEPERDGRETVGELLARRTGVADAQRALDDSTAALAAGAPDADERYAQALERWLALGAADFDVRVDEVAASLGITSRLLEAPTATLSGGEAARVGLAAVLLSRFDVLLLDEPTNDLDFAGLEQLERFVLAHAGPVVVVSHDRAFLDRVVTDVAEIDEHRHDITLYGGGWASYLHERDVARRHASEAFERYEAQRGELLSRAQREREWAHRGVANEKKNPRDGDKVGRKFLKEQTEQLASRARRTERAIERLEAVDEPRRTWELRFTIATTARAGAVVARLDAAVVDRGAFVLGPVSVQIDQGDVVGIVGPNGSGKTTLIQALLGRVRLDAGARHLGPGVVVGEIDQARAAFTGDARVLDLFVDATALPLGDARTLLAKFGIGADHVGRAAASLSPGERTRVALALLQARGVNTLVLDEPTNHLDLPAIEQLEAALARFPGTVLLVTHDRRLLENVACTRVLEVHDGVVRER